MPPCSTAPARLRPGRRPLVSVAALVLVALGGSVGIPSAAGAAGHRRAIVAVFAEPVQANLGLAEEEGEVTDTILRHEADLGLSVGLLSTAQGRYLRDQVVLDITQGTRQPRAVYERELLPLEVRTDVAAGAARVVAWDEISSRARAASTTLQPGLLATAARGAAFVAPSERPSPIGALAADRAGRIAALSTGTRATTAGRALAASQRWPLVVVELPRGAAGLRALEELVSGRNDGTALIALHLPPTRPSRSAVPQPSARFYGLTAVGVAGIAGFAGSSSVTSPTTRQDGLAASIDVAPTVLEHLGVDVPRVMRGHRLDGSDVEVRGLENARRRWAGIRGGGLELVMRSSVLLALGVLVIAGIVAGAASASRFALRTLGLTLLWVPAIVLLVAGLRMTRISDEAQLAALLSMVAALVTARLVPWPRAAAVPAAAGLLLVTVDLARGGPLLTTSLLAPSITTGNRFYGVSNELEPLIPALGLVVLAAIARRSTTSRAVAWSYATMGIAVGVVVAAGRLGADVGGVATVAGAFTVAGFTAAGRRPSLRLVLAVVGAAVAGMMVLVVADLLVGGDSHLSNNLSRASSPRELLELVARRYELAWSVLSQRRNVTQFLAAAAVVAFLVRNREALLGRLPSPAWSGALTGTVGGGVVGAVTNDSGPVLFVNAVGAAAAIAAYLASPAGAEAGATSTPHDELEHTSE